VSTLWLWPAVVGSGVLHGLNPATGWLFAACCGLRSRDPVTALRAVLPIAIGHVAAIAATAAGVALAPSADRVALQVAAAVVLVVVTALSGIRRAPLTSAGLTLWSFITSGAQGAGLALVPALLPLCASTAHPGLPASLSIALAAVALHTGAMLGTTALLAAGVCRGVAQVFGASTCRLGWAAATSGIANSESPIERTRGKGERSTLKRVAPIRWLARARSAIDSVSS